MTRRDGASRPIVYVAPLSLLPALASGRFGPQVGRPGAGKGPGVPASATAPPIQGQPAEVLPHPTDPALGSIRSNLLLAVQKSRSAIWPSSSRNRSSPAMTWSATEVDSIRPPGMVQAKCWWASRPATIADRSKLVSCSPFRAG